MDSDINLHLTNLDDKLDNLLFDDSYSCNDTYKKMNIYNNSISLPVHKIWLELPKLKMLGKINKINNNKDKSILLLSLILYDKDPNIKKLIKFIRTLEEQIVNHMSTINNDIILKSCIKNSDKFFPTINFNLPLNKQDLLEFDIYDINNKKINYEKIELSSFIKLFIEITDIWMNNKEFGINWKFLQMKVYPEFNFNKCLFTDGPINNNNDPDYHFVDVKNTSPPPPPPLPVIKKNNDNITKNNSIGSFAPSVSELLNIKNKLKSVNDKIEVIEEIEPELIDEVIEEITLEPEIIEPEITEIKKPILKKKKKLPINNNKNSSNIIKSTTKSGKFKT